MEKDELDFGSYVRIEQHRYGVPNEMYRYKVIGRLRSNHYTTVPVHSVDGDTLHDEVVPVIACICCGVNETKVQKFRIEDVNFDKGSKWFETVESAIYQLSSLERVLDMPERGYVRNQFNALMRTLKEGI